VTDVRPQTNRVTTVLITLILIAFAVGAYRVDRAQQDINNVIESQKHLIFDFNVETGRTVIECVKSDGRYVCTAARPGR
jgi:hypothetical protein